MCLLIFFIIYLYKERNRVFNRIFIQRVVEGIVCYVLVLVYGINKRFFDELKNVFIS